jgi:hypothetical protein
MTAMGSDDLVNPDIYLCGPMTDVAGSNLGSFAEATKTLTNRGYRVFNPGELQDDGMTFVDYMRPELQILMNTRSALVALPGWENGVGSRLEVIVATSIGLPTHSYDPSSGIGSLLFPASFDPRTQVGDMLRSVSETAPDCSVAPHVEAAELVLGPRGEYYDHPYDNFSRTAHLWTGIMYSKLKKNEVIDPDEVSLCLVALKLAREAFRHKRDNIVDGHGYLITHTMVLDRMREIQQEQGINDDDASR